MKIVPVAEIKARLSSYLDLAITQGPIIITRNGKAAAVLIAPIDESTIAELILTYSPRTQAVHEPTALNGHSGHPPTTANGQAPLPTPTESDLRALPIEERELRFKQKLLELGLMTKINNPDRAKLSQWRPIPTKGKPASQMIIEDRR